MNDVKQVPQRANVERSDLWRWFGACTDVDPAKRPSVNECFFHLEKKNLKILKIYFHYFFSGISCCQKINQITRFIDCCK